MEESNYIIKYSNVEIQNKGIPIFKNLDFLLKQGELMYLAGTSSAGSRILLASFYAHASINGNEAKILDYDLLDITREKTTELRQRIGLVLSENFLYENISLEENLHRFQDIFSEISSKTTDQNLNEWLMSFDLDPVALPEHISENDRILFSLAKAMLNKPQILFIEDHFSQLNFNSQTMIMDKIIQRIRAFQLSVVMIQSNSDFIDRYPGLIYTCDEIKSKVS